VTDQTGRSDIVASVAARLSALGELAEDRSARAAREVAAKLRRLTELLATCELPEPTLRHVEEAVAEALEAASSCQPRSVASDEAVFGRRRSFFEWSPLAGLASPIAPPLRLALEGGKVVALANFSAGYEGPPGCVHGGFIAAAFDEVLGLAQSLSGQVGLTATLSVKYRRPTPLGRQVRFEGAIEQVDGRKVTAVGTLTYEGQLCAEAKGLFVTPLERLASVVGGSGPQGEGAEGPSVLRGHRPTEEQLLEQVGDGQAG